MSVHCVGERERICVRVCKSEREKPQQVHTWSRPMVLSARSSLCIVCLRGGAAVNTTGSECGTGDDVMGTGVDELTLTAGPLAAVCVRESVCERETETERGTERQRDRGTEGQRERQGDQERV